MARLVLEYGPPVKRRRWPKRIGVLLLALVGVFGAIQVVGTIQEELELRRLERAYLTTNAPQQFWPDLVIRFDDDGSVRLPDGRLGVVGDWWPTLGPGLGARLTKEFDESVIRLQGARLGCTVVETPTSGRPVVQIWTLSPRAYAGMCGNSSRVERLRGQMRLWRNVGAFMVEQRLAPPNPSAAPSRISVLGW